MGAREEAKIQARECAQVQLYEQRQEVARLLSLPEIARSNNLVRLLSFICDKYFAGEIDDIREYTIAVEAFGRKPNFDPHADSIVRVTARLLRKRIADAYATGGAPNFQLVLPLGQYVPSFIRVGSGHPASQKATPENDNTLGAISSALPVPASSGLEETDDDPFPLDRCRAANEELTGRAAGGIPRPAVLQGIDVLGSNPSHQPLILRRSSLIAVTVLVAALSFWLGRQTIIPRELSAGPRAVSPHPFEASALIIPAGQAFYYHASDGPVYTDQSGTLWQPLPGCNGGEMFHRPDREISGYRDSSLFQDGRSGQFQCKVPVPAGKYELQFLFAQTSHFAEAGHDVELRINGEDHQIINVADEAAGQARVTARIVTDVEPEADGSIHIESLTNDSFLNVLVILPGIPAHMRPIRFIAAPKPYLDRLGRLWLPDEFFFSGTADRRAFPTAGVPDSGLFLWERYGHFSYLLPVVPGYRYTLRLYFSEGWFGPNKWHPGGAGSRVFDVYCNGESLLKDFDISKEASRNNEAVIKEFHNIVPTAQGKIELSFIPIKDFPLINAVELEQEPPDTQR
jgi:Malectin domain